MLWVERASSRVISNFLESCSCLFELYFLFNSLWSYFNVSGDCKKFERKQHEEAEKEEQRREKEELETFTGNSLRQVVVTAIGATLVDRSGRRPLLLVNFYHNNKNRPSN